MTTPGSHDPGGNQPQSAPGKIAITDEIAVFAWCESGDEAAGAWLCEKYRPLISRIANRRLHGHKLRHEVTDETLRRALSTMASDGAGQKAACWFARVAMQVCGERAREITGVSAAVAT